MLPPSTLRVCIDDTSLDARRRPVVTQASPQIHVGGVYDCLDAGQSSYLKQVLNDGTSTAFVKVNILELIYDANGSYREVPLNSRADASATDGLAASPARLIIPANGSQSTRLLFMGNRHKERYFRVRFVPVLPQTEDEFVISEQERQAYTYSLASSVRVLIGIARYSLRIQGNSVVVIDEFKDCIAGNPHDCRRPLKHHVMAGRSFVFDKEPGREYRLILIEGKVRKAIEIKG